MAYLLEGILLPNDYGGKLRVSDDGNSIENGPEYSKLVYASLKNLVPARALQSLIYDHYEKGTRVYQDTNGDFVTMPASTDGTDQSKITLRRAKQLVAGKFSSSSNDLVREDCPPLPHSEERPLSPRSNGSAGSIDCQDSTAVEASSSVQPPD
ncbi:hypothetical protein Pmar_PMAR023893 [Perkinsus marinus ATCC 50983]|uniref:Uncharacterized protein n=1 Tax=Perkinsus marinus (strain ATCC 50983 / TXsc) TaxID=423536 RepID=C5L1M5_PERM5|nr:hypothetical protein Pmar_PMAR023893 [Perkinsus marinus ATCC 50983]EER09368.1 hypothetical protein Pmar_PMAR023893 [Perkinsus marinus ATCC 50983]|eukprot:XP_002777552.1 hypothetical protein Pmar_PMAR023893 [Perkinsus marinus ATCC 50983]